MTAEAVPRCQSRDNPIPRKNLNRLIRISIAGGPTHHLRQAPLLAKSQIPATNRFPGAPDQEAIMFIQRIAALLMLSGLSVLPIPALAHESDGAAKPAPAQNFSESERPAILQEIKSFADAQISVRDAIKIAEGRVSGAKVVDVSFDGGGGRLAYNVKTYLKEEISAVTIDASTGKLIGDALVTPVSALNAKDRIELAGFSTAVIDLSDVVPIAEAYGSGKAVSVGLDEENGKLSFLVVLITDGSLKQISVAPNEQGLLKKASIGKKH